MYELRVEQISIVKLNLSNVMEIEKHGSSPQNKRAVWSALIKKLIVEIRSKGRIETNKKDRDICTKNGKCDRLLVRRRHPELEDIGHRTCFQQ